MTLGRRSPDPDVDRGRHSYGSATPQFTCILSLTLLTAFTAVAAERKGETVASRRPARDWETNTGLWFGWRVGNVFCPPGFGLRGCQVLQWKQLVGSQRCGFGVEVSRAEASTEVRSHGFEHNVIATPS